MRRLAFMILAFTMIAVPLACSGTGDESTTPPVESASPASDQVRLAVTVAKEIEADPDRVDAILEEHGLTEETFEELLYEIAEDPVLSQEYQQALE
jgi:hypothetical protein